MAERTSFDGQGKSTSKWGPIIGGSALALFGMTRSRGRVPLALGGVAVALYGLARQQGVAQPKARSVHAVKSITVRRPVAEVYAFWRDFQNLPRVMQHLKAIEKTGDNRYRFAARPPLTGRAVEWESEIVEERPNEYISWRSLPNSPVDHAGSVAFRPAPGERGTEVHVTMEYNPGSRGAALAGKLFSPAAAQTIKEEIRHFKEFMEAGEVPTNEGQPAARGA